MMKPLRLLVVAMMMAAPTLMWSVPANAQVAFEFRVNFAPPELPVYEQPICPSDGYIWTPGYWAWDDSDGDYYWVPGTWVLAPQPGFLWTPGYWGWYDSAYVFYPGYWGPVVGFYGGINYGFGYFGHGYEGGRWEGSRFFYNRAVNRIDDREIRNVYENRVESRNVTRVSFNGGNGGVNARATAQEEAAARDRHVGAVAAQQQQINAARADRSLRASENRGKPPVAATSRAGSFSGNGVVAAREGGRYTPPPNRGGNAGGRATNETARPGAGNPPERTDRPPAARNDAGSSRSYVHPSELPKNDRPQPKPSGDARADQRYQQQQQKMYQKQEQDHQKLQQRQDQEHARATQRQANEAQKQQMEQHHQQQTQQMEQRHTQQQQHMEQRAPQPKQQSAPPHGGEPHH